MVTREQNHALSPVKSSESGGRKSGCGSLRSPKNWFLVFGPGWVSSEERSKFWERVAFYNFVQCFTGPGPRCRPTEAMWQAAAKPFLATLTELDPQLLVVLGFELHRQLPPVPHSVYVCGVQHPSSAGFQCSKWHSAIAAGFAAVVSNVPQTETKGSEIVSDCSA